MDEELLQVFCFLSNLEALGRVKLHCRVNCLILALFGEQRTKFEQEILKPWVQFSPRHLS